MLPVVAANAAAGPHDSRGWQAGGLEAASRVAGAVLGAAVADAAATGVHWVYDLDMLQQLEEEVAAQAQVCRYQQSAAAASCLTS